ncbi:hypothetical protein BGZ91_011175, partial [Linnemannia elongata]
CLGNGHLVLPEVIIISPERTSLELEKLDIEIKVSPDMMLFSDFRISDRIQHFSRYL